MPDIALPQRDSHESVVTIENKVYLHYRAVSSSETAYDVENVFARDRREVGVI